jgi:hypothetical protein
MGMPHPNAMRTDIFAGVEPYESGKTAQGVSDLIRPDTSHGQGYTRTVKNEKRSQPQ